MYTSLGLVINTIINKLHRSRTISSSLDLESSPSQAIDLLTRSGIYSFAMKIDWVSGVCLVEFLVFNLDDDRRIIQVCWISFLWMILNRVLGLIWLANKRFLVLNRLGD
ncbi:hypothetical protein LWI29_000230 [Acer saccharum]|uniref:Uncharacterized protein n=1 Tax=Acer saccharum TaxID=4024 RepID=A0AA39RBF8_ACESA|nr:hypothetical protein LWI29_000230 [Acer saccharum]